MKASEQVADLERTIQFLEDKIKTSFSDGKESALRATREKVKGFIDGGADILKRYGLDGPDAYSAIDEIWDNLKKVMMK